MSSQFSKSVELGLKLSQRIYYGKETATTTPTLSAPPRPAAMTAAQESHLPPAVMVYAEIVNPSIVDNPDITSYQPYVHGRCEPPALIPLHMHDVSMEVDCSLDTAFVTVSGAWRVHCVGASERCSCRVAVPMGEEGTILGVEVDSLSKSYHTQLITSDASEDSDKLANAKDGFLIKGNIYTLKIPQVYGGTILSIKVIWSQKLSYNDGNFCLNVPFNFPSYVTPVMTKLIKKEKILVNVNSVAGTEVLYQSTSHPLKMIRQETGKVSFLNEREVLTWSANDFTFSYNVSSNDIVGGMLLQSPSLHDHDQREMFCLYLYPGKKISKKVFNKEIIFIVDISGSMRGNPLESVKTAILAALLKLNPVDNFNIIAFNGSSKLFSEFLVSASKESIEKAHEWIEMNLIAEGSTNISTPLNMAIDMVSEKGGSLPIIFLITDGAVEDEKDICEAMKDKLVTSGSISPRICTFGIGLYCNHYFLQMLAHIGRGYYDAAAFDVDSVNLRLEKLINNASSVILADITIDALKHLESVEFYPFQIPDLLSGCPLLISGRYCGEMPDFVEVCGTSPDLSNFVINAKVKHSKDIHFDRVFARRQINALTSQAWLSGSKQLEDKVAKLSLHTNVPSEYTNIILIEIDKSKLPSKSNTVLVEKTANTKGQKITFLHNLGVGFGNLKSTLENRPPESAVPKLYETSDIVFKVASACCGKIVDCCCCMCFIRFCSRLNDQCCIVLTQLCTVLACFGCIEVCCEICD